MSTKPVTDKGAAFREWQRHPLYFKWNTTEQHAMLNFDAGWVRGLESLALTDEQILDEASHHGFIGSREQLLKFVRGLGVGAPADGVNPADGGQQ